MSIKATRLSENYTSEGGNDLTIVLPELAAPESDPSWRTLANCRGDDKPNFFDSHYWQRAVQVCNQCEVKEQCLAFALKNDIRDGIWGGMTSRQRRAHVEGKQ